MAKYIHNVYYILIIKSIVFQIIILIITNADDTYILDAILYLQYYKTDFYAK